MTVYKRFVAAIFSVCIIYIWVLQWSKMVLNSWRSKCITEIREFKKVWLTRIGTFTEKSFFEKLCSEMDYIFELLLNQESLFFFIIDFQHIWLNIMCSKVIPIKSKVELSLNYKASLIITISPIYFRVSNL